MLVFVVNCIASSLLLIVLLINGSNVCDWVGGDMSNKYKARVAQW